MATGMREKTTNVGGVIKRIWYAMTGATQGSQLLSLDDTGNLEATIKAIETIDGCVERVVKAMEEKQGVILMTADHGNAEQMIDYKTGEPHTAHTTNPVPLVLIGMQGVKLKEGKLADLAPTMLNIIGLEKPDEMTGENLIEK